MKMKSFLSFLSLSLFAFALWGCTPTAGTEVGNREHEHEEGEGALALPALEALARNGVPLRVVATTSIIGDVVGRVGGEAIALSTLMGPGMDPHSYQPGAQDLTVVENAQVIFVNGWDLEEALVQDLGTIGSGVVIVPVSAGIVPLAFEEAAHEGEEHDHTGVDPHVWLSIHNVEQWVKNVELVLDTLDPDHAETYAANAQAYLAELGELEEYTETQLAQIPAEKRVLVTNHEAFGYFAEAYGFEVLGAVIPAASTLAEPSAADLAALIEEMHAHGVCTLFTETTVSDTLAQTVARELSGCETVQVLALYTGALGPVGSGAESYVTMFRQNVDTLVEGLR
jgi:ABC-type Zn uptake system ZnuABC Zn-binding protein ZnuA